MGRLESMKGALSNGRNWLFFEYWREDGKDMLVMLPEIGVMTKGGDLGNLGTLLGFLEEWVSQICMFLLWYCAPTEWPL